MVWDKSEFSTPKEKIGDTGSPETGGNNEIFNNS